MTIAINQITLLGYFGKGSAQVGTTLDLHLTFSLVMLIFSNITIQSIYSLTFSEFLKF